MYNSIRFSQYHDRKGTKYVFYDKNISNQPIKIHNQVSIPLSGATILE